MCFLSDLIFFLTSPNSNLFFFSFKAATEAVELCSDTTVEALLDSDEDELTGKSSLSNEPLFFGLRLDMSAVDTELIDSKCRWTPSLPVPFKRCSISMR